MINITTHWAHKDAIIMSQFAFNSEKYIGTFLYAFYLGIQWPCDFEFHKDDEEVLCSQMGNCEHLSPVICRPVLFSIE